MVRGVGAAELVTVAADGYPAATRLPVIWDEDGGRLVFHLARANPQWRDVPADADVPALAVVGDAEAYVSPSWYATKAEHGRVVPTWNYSAVHFTGRLRRHEDPAWLLDAVTRLTELHEGRRAEPWAVADAPATYVEKQLRAIVGLELKIERVEGEGQAQPEPLRGGPGRRGRRAPRRGRSPRGRRRRADAAAGTLVIDGPMGPWSRTPDYRLSGWALPILTTSSRRNTHEADPPLARSRRRGRPARRGSRPRTAGPCRPAGQGGRQELGHLEVDQERHDQDQGPERGGQRPLAKADTALQAVPDGAVTTGKLADGAVASSVGRQRRGRRGRRTSPPTTAGRDRSSARCFRPAPTWSAPRRPHRRQHRQLPSPPAQRVPAHQGTATDLAQRPGQRARLAILPP